MGWHWQQEREEKFGSICCAVTQPRRGRRIKRGGKKAKLQYFRGGQIARHQFASAASEKKAHEVGFFSRVLLKVGNIVVSLEANSILFLE